MVGVAGAAGQRNATPRGAEPATPFVLVMITRVAGLKLGVRFGFISRPASHSGVVATEPSELTGKASTCPLQSLELKRAW